MHMVSKVTASDRRSVLGMVGAGRDRGLSEGRGSRRWVSVLVSLVATGAVALGAVLGVAPSAAAEEGLAIESQNRYVVEDAGVRATTTLTIRNTRPDQYLTDGVRSFYLDEFGIPVPAGTQNVQATSEGASLQVRIEPTEDPSTAIAVASFRPLNYRQSRTIEWSYTIPGAPFRAADWTRVGPGFAAFVAQGVGDPGNVGVVVVVPASMTFHSTGSFAKRREGDAVTYTATENTDEHGIWAAVSARDPERADERAVEVGDNMLQLLSLPGDTAWTDFAAERVTAGLPVLEDIIGEPWPGGIDKIREDVSPHVLGYAWFDHTADEIVVSEDLDEAMLLHELTHAWLNPLRLQERWLYEGLTEVVAYRAVEALGGTSEPLPAPDRAAPSALALNAWIETTGNGKPHTAVDDYAYAAASNAVGQLVGDLDDDTFTALVVAAYAGESAYELVGSVGENKGRTDWQRFLDLVEVRTGNADAAQVYRTWVVDADQAALLDERATARRAYADVDAADGDWLPPLGLRSAMTDWEFAGAGDVVSGIGSAPADAAAVQDAAEAAGLPEPDAVREAYEEAADADAYAALGSMLPRAVVVVGDVGDASRSAAADRDPFSDIGELLLGVDAAAADARAALDAGDLDAAAESADRAARGAERATPTGVGVVVLVLALVAGAVLGGARRRSRRRAAKYAAADTATVDPADALLEGANSPEVVTEVGDAGVAAGGQTPERESADPENRWSGPLSPADRP
jgi:hypothetical protein